MARRSAPLQRGGGMMQFLRIFRAAFRINVQNDLAYRGDAAAGLFMALFWALYEVAYVAIIFANTTSIGGWGAGEVVALTGMWKIINTLMFAWIYPSTNVFTNDVASGELDYVLLQPASSQMIVSTRKFVVWRFFEVLMAVVIVIGGLVYGGAFVSPLQILTFLVLTLAGMTLLYSVWVVLLSLNFWAGRLNNAVSVLGAFTHAGRYPINVYPTWLRAVLTFLVPIGVATNVPIQALRGDLAPWALIAFLAAAVISVIISVAFWRTGCRRYAGASS
jgi:ABC-2 type transport system permease protein